jgi:hypothetical protein
MGTVPDTQQGSIDFFATRIAAWAANAAAIGLDPTTVTDLASRLSAAQTDLAAAQAAREASKNATLTVNDSITSMRSLGGDLVKTIRAFAETTGDDNVYTLASVPPIAPPAPLGKPPAPTGVTASINSFGYGFIEWNGTRAGGTAFILERQMTALDGTASAWAYAGTSTTEDYTDTTIPTGFKAVTYRVFATRPAGNSPVVTANPIFFGIDGGQSQTASGDTDMTLAA